MTLRVGITGVGVLSALGDRADEVHRALCAGEHARRPLHPRFPEVDERFADLVDLRGVATAPLQDFDASRYVGAATNLRPLDGAGRRLASAAALALAASGWSEEACAAEPVGLVAGTMFAGMRTIAEFDRRALEAGPQYVMPLDFANTVFNAAAGQTAIRYRLTGPNATLGGGPVAGLQALGHATDLVRSGQARAMLAGGVDELSCESLRAFARAGLLSGAGDGAGVAVPFDGRRDGCALGEGAVLFMVEPIDEARRRGAPVLAEIVASASAWAPPAEPDERAATDEVAAALARAIAQVFAQAGVPTSALDAWSASASGAVARDRTEARGFAAAMGQAGQGIAVTAVKGALGEALGASGGLQALALVEAMRSGRLPGIAGLSGAEPGLGITLSADDRAVDLRWGLATAVGIDGAVEALLLRRWEGETGATR